MRQRQPKKRNLDDQPDQGMDHRSDGARGTKRKTGDRTATMKDDWNKFVRLGRFVVRYPRVVNWYGYQNELTDSDWAGCRRTRRSTSGGCTYRGQHMLKFWSKTQAVVALSSAEAEPGAAVKASQRDSRDDDTVDGRT